jgi:cytochrome c5
MSGNESHTHESFIKTPKQLIVVCVLSFVVPVGLILMLVQFLLGGSKAPLATESESVATRIKPLAEVTLAEAGGGKVRTGEEVFKAACAACHNPPGLPNAPKLGDKAAWAKLGAQGLPYLLKSAIAGKGAMPPRGGLSDLSDYELARTIVYMANQSGQSLKEPAEPKPAADKK